MSVSGSFCEALVARPMPGLRPGSRLTFFASPKKVSKERRPRCLAPSGSVAVLKFQGSRRTHFARWRSLRSDSYAKLELEGAGAPALEFSAPHPAIWGRTSSRLAAHRLGSIQATSGQHWPLLEAMRSEPRPEPPLLHGRGTEDSPGVAQRLQKLTSRSCLSAVSVSERSEFCAARRSRVPQRTPQGPCSRGGFFAFFLGRPRKKVACGGEIPAGPSSSRSLCQVDRKLKP